MRGFGSTPREGPASAGLVRGEARAGRHVRTVVAREVAIVCALILIGGVPRLANLLALDPFLDEVFILRWVVLQFDPRNLATYWLPLAEDGRPPLFYWLELALHGVVENPLLAGRLASALPSLLSVPALYGLCRALYPSRVAVIAAVLWAASPFSVFFARIAADDSLLTLCTILVALFAVVMARRHSVVSGALCGCALGLAILSKTLGLLAVAIPLAACMTLVRHWSPRLVGAAAALTCTTAGMLLPLLPWRRELLAKAEYFADTSTSAPLADVGNLARFVRELHLSTFLANGNRYAEWLIPYVGVIVLCLCTVGVVVGILRTDRRSIFFFLIWSVPLLALLDRGSLVYSRYFVFFSFPLYVLAASALSRGSDLIADRLRGPGRARLRSAEPLRLATAVLATCLVVASSATLLGGLVWSPSEAAIPADDHRQYVDQWYAFFGMQQVAERVAEAAHGSPVRVLEPVQQFPLQRVTDALRFSLPAHSAVEFVGDRSLNEATALCSLRRYMADPVPTYIVLNGRNPDIAEDGKVASMPVYTRSMEVALARDLPGTTTVVRVDRPSGKGWLTLYRLGGAAGSASQTECLTPVRTFVAGWQDAGSMVGRSEAVRSVSGVGEYAEGPLPYGCYSAVLYARANGTLTRVTLDLNDADEVIPGSEIGQDWQWLGGTTCAAIPDQGTAHLRVLVESGQVTGAPATPGGGSLQLIVGALFLQRETS